MKVKHWDVMVEHSLPTSSSLNSIPNRSIPAIYCVLAMEFAINRPWG